jgi:hypothetical protein
MKSTARRFARSLGLLLATLLALGISAGAASAQGSPAAQQPYVVEYYYQVRWGYAEEFIRLFRKNHYPVLKKQMESGRLLSVTAVAPRYHATEDRRWDYRVTIVFRNAQVASETDPTLEAIVRQLYPDQETFRREEQRRFEILLAHWDVPTVAVDLIRD